MAGNELPNENNPDKSIAAGNNVKIAAPVRQVVVAYW